MKLHPTKFDGYYVTEDGEIYTEWYRNPPRRGKPRKMTQNPRGGQPDNRYLSVNISLKDENGKTLKQIKYYSHRLIAETLIKNLQNLEEIDHLDRDKSNNSVNNLRWVTRKENMSWPRKKSLKIKYN